MIIFNADKDNKDEFRQISQIHERNILQDIIKSISVTLIGKNANLKENEECECVHENEGGSAG